MSKTYTNALVFDKGHLGIDPVVRNSLRTHYQRNMFIDKVLENPPSSIIEADEDTCLAKAAALGFDFLILTWEGNLFDIHRYHGACVSYIDQLDEQTEGQWLVAGHLINQYLNRKLYNDPNADHWKDSFWFFPITAIVNVKKWVELGSPKWGQQEDGSQTVVKAIPSEEFVHDGYTPVHLHPSEELITVNVKKGWNIINESLKAGIPLYNLSNDIRNNQNYLYPEVDIEKYNSFWNALYMMPKMTDHYKRTFDQVIQSKNPRRIDPRSWQCFIKNTEDYYPKAPNDENMDFSSIETIILPCSGFKDFIFSMGKNNLPNLKEVIHFDIIPQCVEIRKKLLSRWDGTRSEFTLVLEGIGKEYRQDPFHVFHMHSMKSFDEAYCELLKFFNDEETMRIKWNEFKALKHKFIEADALENPYSILNLLENKNIYLCLSDIAGWRSNIVGYGYQNLRKDILKSLFSIRKRELNCIVDYKDPATDLQKWQRLEEAIAYLKSEPEFPEVPYNPVISG